uniref:Uncharacterized protein n=1 Tax=Timema monikensis TaxID=170555 RepID=A0A7R9HK79_9NEOP|nr:unnamed protein product [Timema monikensis]
MEILYQDLSSSSSSSSTVSSLWPVGAIADETIILKQLPVKHAPTLRESCMARSFPYPWLPRPREDCIGLVRDDSDRSTLGHVIANAAINATS